MILRSETVEQSIDFDFKDVFIKDVIMTQDQPIGMVRKRRAADVREGRPSRGAVLLIHGFAQNRYTWHLPSRSFSAYLAHHGWDVFNVDLRGAGRSMTFDGRRPQALDDYIEEDLPACVDEAVELSGHSRIALVGHSMGGLISYGAAATSLRGRVSAIATLGSPYRFGAGSRLLRALSTVLQTTRLTGAFDRTIELPTRLLGRHLHRRRRLWDSALFPTPIRAWRSGNVEDQVLDEYLKSAFDRTNLQIGLDIMAGGDRVALRSRDGRIDYGSAFQAIKVPLLCVAGDRDDLAPPESVHKAIETCGSEDTTFRVFPVGHADLTIGRDAVSTIWPLVHRWLDRRASSKTSDVESGD
ncbi:MAG: alpha/beta hydrolase [Myxococcota bacterium]